MPSNDVKLAGVPNPGEVKIERKVPAAPDRKLTVKDFLTDYWLMEGPRQPTPAELRSRCT